MGYMWPRNLSFISHKFLQKQFTSCDSLCNKRVRKKINFNLIILNYKYSKKSFDEVDLWLKDLKSNSNPDIKVFLIGNKADLEDKRVVEREVAEKIKKDYDLDLFMETSAKTGFNAKELFAEAAKVLFNDYCKYKVIKSPKTGAILKIENIDNNKEKKKGCC